MPFWHPFRPGRATEDTKRCSLTDARIAQTKRIVFREETRKHIFTCTEMPFSAGTRIALVIGARPLPFESNNEEISNRMCCSLRVCLAGFFF